MLVDKFGRHINYLRLAVTDKCNLRCFYCMPEKGIDFLKKSEILSFEEMLRLSTILAKEGINKVRITGGEPFLRKEIIYFLKDLSSVEGVNKIALTTNGTLTSKYLNDLLKLGIRDVNLSLDSLDKDRFHKITRRDSFDIVWNCLQEMLSMDFNVKINCVVMEKENIEDILPMIELTKSQNISIRFIEEMPFNGTGAQYDKLLWDHKKILSYISDHYNNITSLDRERSSTSFNYQVSSFKGDFGIIPAYTRSICGGCNRIRITPKGMLKSCLYDNGVFSLRDLMRAGATDAQVVTAIKEAISNKTKDGFAAEKKRNDLGVSESMATIGG